LKCRLDLENDATLVELAEDDGNLSLAEGVIERVIDQLWRQPEPADNVAVELEHEPRGGGLQVAGHVLQLRQGDAHIDELPRPERVSRIFGRALGRAFGRYVDITTSAQQPAGWAAATAQCRAQVRGQYPTTENPRV
jgi:hypothetical protein